jgi:hypothetical protein
MGLPRAATTALHYLLAVDTRSRLRPRDLDDDLRVAMAAWAADNQRGSRGEHRYSLAEYGLTAEQIDDAFADYLAVYGDYCRPAPG